MNATVEYVIGDGDEPGQRSTVDIEDLPGDFTDIQVIAEAARLLDEFITVPQRAPIDHQPITFRVVRVDPQ